MKLRERWRPTHEPHQKRRALTRTVILAAAMAITAACGGNPAATATLPVSENTRQAGVNTPTADPTQAARQRLTSVMNDIDGAITAKAGDMLPDVTLPLAFPDGSTRDVRLYDFIRDKRTIIYYYFQDNTPL